MEAGSVEAGQPHIPNYHEPERVLRVLESLGETFAAGLVSDVLLPL
jgi:hypothetical protein